MLAILFPHMFEDIEFLLEPQAMDLDVIPLDVASQQPVAGPSRLR